MYDCVCVITSQRNNPSFIFGVKLMLGFDNHSSNMLTNTPNFVGILM